MVILSVLDESNEILYGTAGHGDKFFTLHREDLQCKRIITQCVSLLIKTHGEGQFLEIVKSSPYFKVLVYFIQLFDGDQISGVSRYSIQQAREL